MKPANLHDCVIYASTEDRCWLAHGLYTDQIGTGEDLADALRDYIVAVEQVMEAVAADETINPFRRAPVDVFKLFENAVDIPREIYEIAHRRATGDWPEEFNCPVHPPSDEQYKIVGRALALT